MLSISLWRGMPWFCMILDNTQLIINSGPGGRPFLSHFCFDYGIVECTVDIFEYFNSVYPLLHWMFELRTLYTPYYIECLNWELCIPHTTLNVWIENSVYPLLHWMFELRTLYTHYYIECLNWELCIPLTTLNVWIENSVYPLLHWMFELRTLYTHYYIECLNWELCIPITTLNVWIENGFNVNFDFRCEIACPEAPATDRTD